MKKVSLDLEAINPETGVKVKETFCNDWEDGKKALQGLAAAVKNPILKLMLTEAIALGDYLKTRICK